MIYIGYAILAYVVGYFLWVWLTRSGQDHIKKY